MESPVKEVSREGVGRGGGRGALRLAMRIREGGRERKKVYIVKRRLIGGSRRQVFNYSYVGGNLRCNARRLSFLEGNLRYLHTLYSGETRAGFWHAFL